jgi:hypothetical protein
MLSLQAIAFLFLNWEYPNPTQNEWDQEKYKVHLRVVGYKATFVRDQGDICERLKYTDRVGFASRSGH